MVREYYGEQLRSERTEAWRECNRRLYDHYRSLVPGHPDTFREMEPLFLAVICGCHAGLFREALHEVYVPQIQRGNVYFAANVLGARGALISVLVHFFEQERWDAPVHKGIGGQILTADDQLFILAQSALYLTAIRGMGSPEARFCCQRMESVCRTVDRPQLLYVALMGQWRYSLTSDKLSVSLQLARRIHSLAQEQNDSAFMVGACIALAQALYFMGDFETAGQHAMRGVQIWRSEGAHSRVEDVDAPIVTCLLYTALCQWHLGDITSCHVASTEAISLAKELNDAYILANALFDSAVLAYFENNVSDVERLTSEVIELSTRHKFTFWLTIGSIMRGWARSASGHIADGISWIEDGLREYRGSGWTLGLPFYLAVKAQAFYLADRASEALEAIGEAEALAESLEVRWWCAELRRLRGVFLGTMGAEETQIEASFCTAIRIAKEQKSVSLQKRAEGTDAEYRRQKASASGGGGFRLPLW